MRVLVCIFMCVFMMRLRKCVYACMQVGSQPSREDLLRAVADLHFVGNAPMHSDSTDPTVAPTHSNFTDRTRELFQTLRGPRADGEQIDGLRRGEWLAGRAQVRDDNLTPTRYNFRNKFKRIF